MKGVTDVDDDYDRARRRFASILTSYKMGKLGLTVSSVASRAQDRVFRLGCGQHPSQRREDGHHREVSGRIDTLDHLRNLSVPNSNGDRIPIKSVADIVFDKGLLRINHTDRDRTITVDANVIQGQANSRDVNKELMRTFGTRSAEYAGYSFVYGGEFQDTQESLVSVGNCCWCPYMIVYIIMALLFRSYLQPLIVMTAVPFSFIGVVYGLFIMDLNLSITALIAVVALVGLVVNDAIVLVDFINRSREEGMSAYDAVVASGRVRLRPIILTTVTTIGGLLSMALGFGGRESMLTPMAAVVVWGLLFSTTLTLLVVPCLYMIIEDIRQKFTGEKA